MAGVGAGSPWGLGSIVKWSVTNWPWLSGQHFALLGLSFLICPGLWVDQDGLKALPALPGLGAEPQFLSSVQRVMEFYPLLKNASLANIYLALIYQASY